MPAPIAKAILITVSVIAAASLAAYENPQVRQWIDQSRRKIAMALHSLGDDIYPRSPSPRRDDPSMREDASEIAEEKRRQARQEIMERGRILEERRRRKRASQDAVSAGSGRNVPTGDASQEDLLKASTSAVDTAPFDNTVIHRKSGRMATDLRESADSPISLRQLSPTQLAFERTNLLVDGDPWANQYEEEMRNTWNLPLLPPRPNETDSHASESLIDLTPRSESVPDPDISIPLSPLPVSASRRPLDHSKNSSAADSLSSHTLSDNGEPEYYYAHPSNPTIPVLAHRSPPAISVPVSSAPSVAGSMDHVHASELESDDDGVMSELGDGILTPVSAWTDVGSVSGSDSGL